MGNVELVYLKIGSLRRIQIPKDIYEKLELNKGDWVSITIQKLSPAVKVK